MREEAADVREHVDDARRFIENGDGRRAQPEAADLARPVEVERRIELGFGHDAHADAAGNRALRLAALPHAAAMLVDQRADADAERQLDAARLVDVAADAIEFRPVAAGV